MMCFYSGQMGGYYNPYTSGFSAAHMAAAAAAAAAQQSGQVILFPVWLRNRLLSAGLELVLRHTEKSCIVSYYRQFFMNIKM